MKESAPLAPVTDCTTGSCTPASVTTRTDVVDRGVLLQADLHPHAAAEVDAEIEPHDEHDDEGEDRDRGQRAQEPPLVAHEVNDPHDRPPSSSGTILPLGTCRPRSFRLRKGFHPLSRLSMERVTRTAVNMERATPMPRVSAKPLMPPVAAQNRMMAVRMVVMLQSNTARKAFLKPALVAAPMVLPGRHLVAHAGEDEHVGVDRHAQGEDHAGDAGQGHRDPDGVEDAQEEHAVDDEGDAGHHAQQTVVGDHEDHDEQQADGAGDEGLVESRLAQGGADGVLAHRQ